VAASRLRRLAALGLVAAGLSGGTARDWAEDEVNVQFHGFEDSRDATVLSPTVDLSKDFTDRTSLKAKFGLDAISAASDSCVRCHRPGAHDTRLVGGASLTRKLSDTTKVTAGAEVSHESFYQSTTILASISKELNKGNTTIAGGYSFSLNRPQLHPSAETQNQYANSAFLNLTQTLTRTTIGQFGYEIDQVNGYQSSPFLRALVNGSRVLGVSPDSRTRHAVTARIRQALPLASYLEADYRFYGDSWSLKSNSIGAGLSHYVTRELLANFTYRFYQQTGAFFYEPEYSGAPTYFTADFRLAPFHSGLYQGRLTFAPKGGVFFLPAGTALTGEYEFYRSTSGFEAAVFTGGVRVPLGSR
jgi:hypothetical protein